VQIIPSGFMAPQKSFLNSVKWAYTANWGERVFSALFTFVLAAVLGPRDFGVVGIAMVYITFLQLFLDQGFMAALIQKKELEAEHLDAVFWMDLVLSLFLVGTSILLSGWWAARNHAPDVARLISVLSLCIPIHGLAAVQGAILSKNMDFKALSIRANIAVLLSGVVGLGMAAMGFRVWALVGQQIVRDLAALILLWKLSPWRPGLKFSWKHLKELMGFSVSNFAAQLAIFADTQSSSIFLGLLFGPVAVGLYRLADRLVNSVVAMATSSIQSVSLPEFARFQDQPEELRRSALVCIRLSSTVTLPALSGMAAVSWALMAALGSKWIPVSDALKVLCLMGMSIVFASFTGPMLQALAKTQQLALLEWARMVVGTIFIIAAGLLVRNSSETWQLMGIALARFATITCIVAPIFLYILMRLSRISFRDVMLAIAPSAASSLAVVAAVSLFKLSGWLAFARPLSLLVAEIFVGGTVGVTVLLVLDTQLRGIVVSLPQRILGSFALSRSI
jgi:O-antigen/teichoic acid export membrane protein